MKTIAHAVKPCRNFIGGNWEPSASFDRRKIVDPATGDLLTECPAATPEEVHKAVDAASHAFPEWSRTSVKDRVQYLFKFNALIGEHMDELTEILVREHGKMWADAKGDIQRGKEVVEFSTGMTDLLRGEALWDAATSVDVRMVREPLGVTAGATPYNFPAMIPLWMLPVSIACGNTFILKPSDQAPMTAVRLVELLHETGLPPGVVNLVHGAKGVMDGLIGDARVKAISFVGSSAVAEQIYMRCAAAGKRVLSMGGAKNHLVVMPDADLARTADAVINSAFGCTGQRCMAAAVLILVGDRPDQDRFFKAVYDRAEALRLGHGLYPDKYDMGPLTSQELYDRVLFFIGRGVQERAKLALDGRPKRSADYPDGLFMGATMFDDVGPDMAIAQQEIFGPVLAVIRARTLDEAIEIQTRNLYGNGASIFTSSGAAARTFARRASAGMIGVNVGVPVPRDPYAFGGWNRSAFGAGDITGSAAVRFWTRDKKITERWFV
ncbi:MAG: methylmalonate-semialdehyde dehydrogenase (acylating) [Candidatus Lindowbacteria bacterium RIFCSPLOWO2_12_FULL_62_27]|nr:MAG: methylmalonate-semialdehyde dehydrogenase (acylating) [Candidatus Lindowbacteria bacterium RIFCSPLOWO2_12_FULL_62_27]OGH57460.1 MAG: methylmalonate-semialdehyde dehydrogenase (acylating) [Candidatus Lindowbacteria bacterium RIFCSPLOWO2_02_FULL_62_12]